LDGRKIGMQGLTQRDREIREMEDALLAKARSEMTPEELEQLELVEEHEKALMRKVKGIWR